MRGFYGGLLEMTEEAKPAALSVRGGCWLRSGPVSVHVGVEEDFRPARKAHPAFGVRNLEALAERLAAAGHEVRWDDSIPGVRRFHTDDPVGNRVEFLQD